MFCSKVLLGTAACLFVACSGNGAPKTPIGAHDRGAPIGEDEGAETLDETKPAELAPVERDPVAPDAVEKAIRPLSAVVNGTSERVDQEIFLTRLASATGVCVGESHDSLDDHALELVILRGLLERRPMRGFELGLGLEMVRAEFQPELAKFDSGKTWLNSVPVKTRWAEEWGYPFEYFLPHFSELRTFGGVKTLGLGVSRELSMAIATDGIDGLKDKYKRKIPALDRSQPAHRKLFDTLMEGHPHGDIEKMYEAQLVWDESMADVGAKFVAERSPIRKLLIFAGAAHCHATGIPSRLERRTPGTVVSVLREDPSHPPELREGYDYLVKFD